MSSASPSSSARLVADIGGTNGRFAIERDGAITARREYRNSEFADLPTLVRRYLHDAGSADDDVKAACLAVAAPLSDDGEARFTNSTWTVSSRLLHDATGMRVALINDFAAQAYGLETLGVDDVVAIAGSSAPDPATRHARIVLGPGTGLGCAASVPSLERTDPPTAVTTEGGHLAFAAETDDDRRIFDLGRARHGRVSWERVVSGSGLALIHSALSPDDRLSGVAEGDPSAVVEAARADRDSAAARSVRHFCGLLGAYAGDLALLFRAVGGVYLTGGVVGHLDELFDAEAFLARFTGKGRYRDWMADVPVARIAVDDCALRGCARFLARR